MLNAVNCKKVAGTLLVLLVLLVSGCWDRREIENRGYVLGVGIDYVESPGPKGQYDLDKTTQAAGSRKYKATFEMPKFRKQEGSKEISSGQSHLIWSAEGESMFAITRAISAKTYFGLFFEDIQIIIFSNQVARDGIRDILDFFQRDAEMRRRVKLFVTPGRAEDILKAKLQVEEVNSLFIGKIIQSVGKYPFFSSKTELGQISSFLLNKRSFAIPMLVVENKEVRLTKGAVFNKDVKMVGELTELEVMGTKILRNNLKYGLITAPNPADPTKLVTFELYEPRIEIISQLTGQQLKIAVKAVFIGRLGENMAPDQDALDESFTTQAEQNVAKQISEIIRGGYHKQQQLKAEVSELGNLVHRQHPRYWKQIKDRWDEEIFPTVPLNLDVRVIITRPVIMR